MLLPKAITEILKRLNSAGFEAFVVGGAVRDALMGLEPSDFDITTSAIPNQVMALFEDKKVIPTGLKHGTVTVIYDKMPVEITTYRIESGYSDARHPDNVEFSTSIKDDLSRRDFTVNAICFSPEKGYFDPFLGRDDIKNRLLKTVGEPTLRFKEDALRILRTLRFASKLGFEVEDATKKAVFELKESLSAVSKERIMVELKKTLKGKDNAKILKEFYPVIKAAIPLPEAKSPNFSCLENINKDDIKSLFAAFFICIEKSPSTLYLAEAALASLKADNALKKSIALLIKGFFDATPGDKIQLKLKLKELEPEILKDIIALKHSFKEISVDEKARLLGLIDEILKNNEAFRLSHLDITGNHLLELGIEKRCISSTLNRLLEGVINEQYKNENQALLKEILAEAFKLEHA